MKKSKKRKKLYYWNATGNEDLMDYPTIYFTEKQYDKSYEMLILQS